MEASKTLTRKLRGSYPLSRKWPAEAYDPYFRRSQAAAMLSGSGCADFDVSNLTRKDYRP